MISLAIFRHTLWQTVFPPLPDHIRTCKNRFQTGCSVFGNGIPATYLVYILDKAVSAKTQIVYRKMSDLQDFPSQADAYDDAKAAAADWAILALPQKRGTGRKQKSRRLASTASLAIGCGGRIWTYDLRVMSPTSCQTAPPRVCKCPL